MNLDIEQNNLILEHQIKLPTPPIIQLANSFNILVYKDNKMDRDISGAIINEKDNYSIYVNGNEHEHRRCFTIAHLLSHYLLHCKIIEEEFNGNLTDNKSDDDIMYRYNLYNIFEKEASQLASEILIPIDKIHKNDNIKDLIDKFDVQKNRKI